MLKLTVVEMVVKLATTSSQVSDQKLLQPMGYMDEARGSEGGSRALGYPGTRSWSLHEGTATNALE